MAPTQTVVLILDADEATRELYRRALWHSFRVFVCASEHEAMQQMARGRVDVIVLEPVALQDKEWEFVARVRANAQYRAVPIVVCSTLDARRHGVEVGVNAYLIKPVSPQVLAATLHSVLLAAGVQPQNLAEG